MATDFRNWFGDIIIFCEAVERGVAKVSRRPRKGERAVGEEVVSDGH